jgi:sec-independent protein translocase protein TatA
VPNWGHWAAGTPPARISAAVAANSDRRTPAAEAVVECPHRAERRHRPRRHGERSCTMSLGIPEMLVIVTILVLIFGANRLPELARGMGRGIRNFKAATREGIRDDHKA